MIGTSQEQIHDIIRHELSSREEELIDLHARIVQVPSINLGDGSSAGEDRVAAIIRDYYSDVDVDVEIVESEPGRSNLLARSGKTGGRSMLWMSHSDVVPPGDESAWTHPPFSAARVNGRIYGRGSNDCKMLVAAQVFTHASLTRLNLPVKGSLKVAVGADEEVGGALGFGWLQENRAEFLKSDLAICEGGGECLGVFNGNKPAIALGTGEKGRYEVIFTAKSKGGHACIPWGADNPIRRITQLFERINHWQPELDVKAPVFKSVGKWVGLDQDISTGNVEDAIRLMDKHSTMLGSALRGQSRMTLTPTMIDSGDKSNAIPTSARLVCDSRLLPGQGPADLEKTIHQLLEGLENIGHEIHVTTAPSVSEFSGQIHQLFESACERALDGKVEITPVLCVGATDARFVRETGTPVYGFQLVHPDADPGQLHIHCIDESIEERMLLTCALSLAHLTADYLSPSS
jgi:acetylornithine deacetylase/succinyl-diaminopimelate desuccinylase-like protein